MKAETRAIRRYDGFEILQERGNKVYRVVLSKAEILDLAKILQDEEKKINENH